MIGEILSVVSLTIIPYNYLPADGRCLPISQYQELAEVIHDGDYWPYGKCIGNDGFKLPDLRGSVKITQFGEQESVWIIRVK